MSTTPSSHPLLSCADGAAKSLADPSLLIGRILIAALFLMTVWFGNPTSAYLTSMNYIYPDIMAPLARTIEWIVVVSLVLGIGTRYGALLGLAFTVIALVTAHRYWGYPEAAQGVQYTFLTKDIAIAGGLLMLFVAGAGRISVDQMLAGKH